jgi:uncharacterized RDD family membrane protein YckC
LSTAAQAKMIREFITPEGIDLRLTLGDAGERVSAFFLDVLFILGALIVMTLVVVALGLATRFRVVEFMGVIWVLGFFLLRNFYFMAFEMTFRAATPGKRIIGLRVASRDGSPLTANAIFARNAMRELEVFLPLTFLLSGNAGVDAWIALMGIVWCGIFVIFPLLNRDRLRIGDLVGGTWVVVAPKRVLDAELLAGALSPQALFSDYALDAYGIKELTILEDVLRRKDAGTLAAVAARIRAKIRFDTPMTDAEFLAAYYVGLRGRLESQLLFGKRRKDKYEKV